MKAENVIYYNQYTGTAELCNSKDVEKGRRLDLPFGSYYTEDIAKNLILNGEANISVYGHSFDVNKFLCGQISNNGARRLKKQFHFVIVSKDSSSVFIRMTVRSNFDGETVYQEKEFAKIEFKRSKYLKYGNCIGDALIRIYDFHSWNSDFDSESTLGQFALFVGLYIFVDLDGDWESLSGLGQFVDKKTDEQTKAIKTFIEDAQISISSKTDDILEQQSIMKAKQEQLLKSESEHHATIIASMDKISSDVEYIKNVVNKISTSLDVYREDFNVQIDKGISENELEILVNELTERVSNKITSIITEQNSDKEYQVVRNELIAIFSKDEWDKLSDKTQGFLITAKVLFAQLSSYNQDLDYSGICILVAKALEVEMKRRFYYDFFEYLVQNYNNDFSKWHHSLYENCRTGYKELDENKYTLGTVAYTCCLYKPANVSSEKFNVSKQRIIEFAKNNILKNTKSENVFEVLKYIGTQVNHIKDSYRNPAAHTNYVNKISAENCINEVIDIQKVLLNIIKLFRY